MSFVNQYRSTTIYGELKVQKYNTGNIAGLLDVSGNALFRGDVGVNGNLYATDGTVDISGNLAVSGNITGTFSGSIANATNTTNVLIATDSSNQSFFPTFVSATTGNLPLKVDTGITYNPSTNVLSCDVSGNLTGSVIGNLTGTASSVNVTVDGTNTSYRIPFLSATSGSANIYSDAGITYNPSTNVLTATSFNGSASLSTSVDVNTATASSVHYLPIFTGAAAGTKFFLLDTGLNYNRATDTLSVTNINGSAAQVSVSTTNTGTRYLGMFAGSGDRTCLIDTGLTYDASNNILYVGQINSITIGDGGGDISTNIGVGTNTLINNTTGSNNNAVGHSALYSNTTGSFNSAVGGNALTSNTTASYNTAVGADALFSNTTGVTNNAVGVNALYDNTTGSANNAVGYGALRSNTTGTSNVAVGDAALVNNTTGTYNIAIGRNALSNNNAYSNVAIGDSGLIINTTGASNTSVGYRAGILNIGGSNNTFLGASADIDASGNTWSNSTAIGANCKITASNTIFMGTTSQKVNVLGTLTQSRIAFKTQSYASGDGNTSVDLADGNHFFITGTTAFRLTLPNSSLNDGDFLYLRKTNSTGFVVTLSWSTVSLINTSNVSQTSTNATLFAGGVFELKMIYRAANTSWYITSV
jgi:hypothetical protein